MKLNLCTLDWVAIGSIATALMAIATFRTLNNNKKQFKELQKQNVEGTLFSLLAQVKQLICEIKFLTVKGYEAITKSYDCLCDYDKEYIQDDKGIVTDCTLHPISMDVMKKYYEDSYWSTKNLGSYYRSLYRVIKFIDESNFSDKEKYQYTSFIRAQLTDVELYWLFYNCTVGYGVEKFKPLIEKYTLLKNMPIGGLVRKEHIEWIDKSAYERYE